MAEAENPGPARLAVLISGSGTTLKNLLEKIARGDLPAEVVLVVSSSSHVGGLRIAHEAGIPCVVLPRENYPSRHAYSQALFEHCRNAQAAWVVMGGFLKRVSLPPDFVNRVINIHPSLIPAFCGQGFYGHRVHAAVLEYGAKLTGCTVHFVDDEYDHGPIILQRAVPVLDDDTPDRLAARVFAEECVAYPDAIRALLSGRVHVEDRRVRVLPIQDADAGLAPRPPEDLEEKSQP